MKAPDDCPVPGVRGLEHTADVGLEITAPGLEELFRRGGLGTMWLILDRPAEEVGEEGTRETRTVELKEEDLPALFRSWLRELLFWQETDGFVAREVSFLFLPVPGCQGEDGQVFGLEARVTGNVHQGPVEREIKGVTLHGLRVEERDGEWAGQVIFDV